MKKMPFIVLGLLFIIVGLIVYSGSSMNMEDYLNSAQKFSEEGNYDQAVYSFNKALEKAGNQYGEISSEAAGIYVKLGRMNQRKEDVTENLDKAYSIYEALNEPDHMAEVQLYKGMKLTGLKENEAGSEALLNAIELYKEFGYENSDNLCLAYVTLADLQEDFKEAKKYLNSAQGLMEGLSSEGYETIASEFYLTAAVVCFKDEDYQQALVYYKSLMEMMKDPLEAADVSVMYGACLIYVGRLKEAEECLDRAIAVFEETANGSYIAYSIALAYRGLAYANEAGADAKKAMEYGEKALSIYTTRRTIKTADMRGMEQCRLVMQEVFKKVYPGEKASMFNNWYDRNSRLTATTYYYYWE